MMDSESKQDWAGRDSVILVSNGPKQGQQALARWVEARLSSAQERSDVSERRDGGGRQALWGGQRVVVVVPSRPLAENLAGRLAARPRCRMGVSVVTLHGLAHQVVQAAGGAEGSSALLDLLVSRAVDALPELRRLLSRYQDVDQVLAQTVRDFLHAGVHEGLDLALDDLAEGLVGNGLTVELARQVVRAVSWVLDQVQSEGLVLGQQLLGRAAALLESAADSVHLDEEPFGGFLLEDAAYAVYGFADVTGLGLDFLSQVAKQRPMALFVDLPVDPAQREDGFDGQGWNWDDEIRTRPAWRFAWRLVTGLRGAMSVRSGGVEVFSTGPRGGYGDKSEGSDPRGLVVWKTQDPHGEMAAVAAQVRFLLDRGVVPQDIAIVFRDPAMSALELGSRLRSLGVPFSSPPGSGFGPRDPKLRPLARLARMLRLGPDSPIELWAQTVQERAGASLRKLVAGTRLVGLTTLAQAAEIGEPFWSRLPETLDLPLASARRRGRKSVEGAGEEGGRSDDDSWDDEFEDASSDDRDASRTVEKSTLRAFVEQAAVAGRWLSGAQGGPAGAGVVLDGHVPWDDWLEGLLSFVTRQLGWPAPTGGADGHVIDGRPASLLALMDADDPGKQHDLVAALAASLRGLVPESVPVLREEFFSLAARRIDAAGRLPLGGAGGGVQVMSVTQARGCSFGYLFLPGLDQGIFPRTVSEDPLLPDQIRRRIRQVLADLPIKSEGHDEELYLFCQLLAAADHVVISWHEAGLDGKVSLRSALLERLWSADEDVVVPSHLVLPGGPDEAPSDAPFYGHLSPASRAVALMDPQVPRTPRDLALGWALSMQQPGSGVASKALVEPLCLLLERGEGAKEVWSDLDRAEVARARARIFAESTGAGDFRTLGPFLGAVGPVDQWLGTDDEGGRHWWATSVERFARCPWRWFLDRILELEPPPDPLAVELDWDGRMLGDAVHQLMQDLVDRGGTASQKGRKRFLESVERAEPIRPVSPGRGELWPMALEAAEKVLARHGPSLADLARPMAEEMIRFVQVALDSDWAAGPPPVLGTELSDGWTLPDGTRISFRADRVDRIDGRLLMTDYKTGRAVLESKKPKETTIAKQARRAMFVQAVAYGSSRPEALGRYLYLSPNSGPVRRSLVMVGQDGSPVIADDLPGWLGHSLVVGPDMAERTQRSVSLCLWTWKEGWAPPTFIAKGSPCWSCDYQQVCSRVSLGARRRFQRWYEEGHGNEPAWLFVARVAQGRDVPQEDEDDSEAAS